MADPIDEAWEEFSRALDAEIADWKQAVIAGMRERHPPHEDTDEPPGEE